MQEVSRHDSYLYIKNFHRFKSPIKFPLRRFTILLGPNGSGKSALSNAFIIFKNSILSLNVSTEERKSFLEEIIIIN
ncbi:AAA family ATPase [Ignavibacterium sp.]|jgi:predicted ATPase|uniref:AAA family ATPase n=1 Tax=Ignavibacterium sp. TaxID=2651167 RepID=UPI003458C620